MKNILFLLSTLLLLSGCTYKNEAIHLASYKADYTGPVTKNQATIYLRWIKDVRTDKSNIGYLLQNGEKLASLYSDVDFTEKYKEGLQYALNMAGFSTDAAVRASSMVVEVYIKNIEIVYNDKNFDKNLQGEIELEVIIRRGNDVITQNFKQKGGKWIAPSFNSKDLEPFLYTLFSDSINDIVARLARI